MAGWTLIVTGLVVAVIWGASGWWQFCLHTQHCSLFFDDGRWCVKYNDLVSSFDNFEGVIFRWKQNGWRVDWLAGNQPYLYADWQSASCDLWVFYYGRWREDWLACLALWPIPLLLWAAGVPVLRSGILARRRAKTGHCSKCGYSLAGLGEGAKCPECGTVRSRAKRMNAGSEAVRSNGPPQSSDGGTT